MTGVLKRQRIRQNDSPAAMQACGAAGPPDAGPPAQASAVVVEQADGQAVIEVTCSCGRKITVRCDYETPGPA